MFEKMHNFLFEDHYEHHGAGRPRLLDTHDELAFILFYLGSCMTLSELCHIFSYTPTRGSLVVNQQLQFLSRKLRHDRKAKISLAEFFERKRTSC